MISGAQPIAEPLLVRILRSMTQTTDNENVPVNAGDNDPMFPNLRRIADEIRVRIHLAGLDAKDVWAKLETRLHELEGRAAQLGGRAKDELVELGSTLQHELRELMGRLPGRAEKQEDDKSPVA